MAEIRISITEVEAVRPLLDAVAAVASQWDSMTRCYIGSEENVQLAELLDVLADATTNFARKGEKR